MFLLIRFNKRILLALLLLLFIGSFCLTRQLRTTISTGYQIRPQFPPLVYIPDYQTGVKVRASASVLIEAKSGTVLFADNAETRRAPASTTKMMTAIVALEKGDLAQVIRVSRRAAQTGGSTIWLKAGDQLTLLELLEGMMLRSGNDGSMAVAEGVAGSVERFLTLMNAKAKEIGALNTNFRNPHGLRAPSHYTTALDLALIARYGLENPRFAELVSEKVGILEWANVDKAIEIKNTNKLLWYLEGADGVKTGTTNEAGHCLVASATRDGKKLIAVVLNSNDRWNDCARLLEYGFNNFEIITIAAKEQPVTDVRIKHGRPAQVKLYPRRDLIAVVRKEQQAGIESRVRVFEGRLKAPVKAGQPLGKISYLYEGKVVDEVDLITNQTVKYRWW